MGLALPTATNHATSALFDSIGAANERAVGRAASALPIALVLGGLLLVMSPALVKLFGSERAPSTSATNGVARDRLEVAACAVTLRMDELRSDMTMIGTTDAVSRLLRGSDITTRRAVSHDLEAFLAAKAWCRRVSLTREGAPLVTAARSAEDSGCERLARAVSSFPSGVFLADTARSAAGPSLCLAVTLDPTPGRSTAIVAAADPVAAFGALRLFAASGEQGPFLRDGGGSWLIAPPDGTDLVSSTAAVHSWEGPAGGRFEVAAVRPGR